MADKEHTYPKTKSTEMKKAASSVLGDSKKATSTNGPHLKQGNGTAFQQAKITSGFLAQNPRPGHQQKINIDDQKDTK